jgi:hypothetical protein
VSGDAITLPAVAAILFFVFGVLVLAIGAPIYDWRMRATSVTGYSNRFFPVTVRALVIVVIRLCCDAIGRRGFSGSNSRAARRPIHIATCCGVFLPRVPGAPRRSASLFCVSLSAGSTSTSSWLAGSTVVKKRLRDPARMQLRARAIAPLQIDILFDFSLDTSYDKDIRNYADRFRARQRARLNLTRGGPA